MINLLSAHEAAYISNRRQHAGFEVRANLFYEFHKTYGLLVVRLRRLQGEETDKLISPVRSDEGLRQYACSVFS